MLVEFEEFETTPEHDAVILMGTEIQQLGHSVPIKILDVDAVRVERAPRKLGSSIAV